MTDIVDLYEAYLIEKDPSELGVLLAKLKANCLDRIIETSKGETRDALQANKYLLEFSPKDDTKRGRPSKQDILVEAKKIAEDNVLLEESYDRLFNKE